MKMRDPDSDKLRAILVDWLIEVHFQFKLLPETLFLTVSVLDRYLEQKQMSREQLQLVGVSSLLIACKYEEILTPEIRDLEFITDYSCKRTQILATEADILATLGYSLTVVTPNALLSRFASQLKLCFEESMSALDFARFPHWETLHFLSRYIAELQLTEYRMLRYPPSVLAAASLYLALKVLRTMDPSRTCMDWPAGMAPVVGHAEREVRDCAKDLCVLLQNAERSSLQAVRKKYILPEYWQVALIKVPESAPSRKVRPATAALKGYRDAR